MCGCDGPASTIERRPSSDHPHPHPHDHPRTDHDHARAGQPAPARAVRVETAVLAKNDRLAAANRDWFERRQLRVLNLVSSPGAGKTTLLERTLWDLRSAWPWAVIEGDQQTDHDARRIAACGAPVVQLNTGTMCHLDARMVADASGRLDPPPGTMLVIENVGNLVCPALFDLGEAARIVVASVTEGDDKPAKYPYMFETAHLVVLNKCDLLPYVPFDVARFEVSLRGVNPAAPVLRVSATRGDGLPAWYAWLGRRTAAAAGGV
jgi:hydrogenase nickel incorporation protein HypB